MEFIMNFWWLWLSIFVISVVFLIVNVIRSIKDELSFQESYEKGIAPMIISAAIASASGALTAVVLVVSIIEYLNP